MLYLMIVSREGNVEGLKLKAIVRPLASYRATESLNVSLYQVLQERVST